MELDLDALLQSQTSSDEDDDDNNNNIHRRTVDEILNDSDSSSSSSSVSSLLSLRFSNPLPKEPNQIPSQHVSTQNPQIPEIEQETLGLSEPREKSEERRSSFLNRRLSGEYSGTSIGRSYSRPLPPLFGGIKPNPKPGAALAAAAAASRSVPSPHAAAIKFRRASIVQNMLSSQESAPSVRDSDISLDEDLGSDDRVFSGVGSEIAQLDGKLAVEDDHVEVSPSPEVELVSGQCRNEEILGGDEAAEIARDGDEVFSGDETQIEQVESVGADGDEFGTVMDSNSSASIAFEERQISSGNENAYQVDENSTISGSVDVFEENAVPSSPENENGFKVDDNFKFVESSNLINVESFDNSRSDANELIEDRSVQLESDKRGGKKAGKKSRSSMKPLEAAEELEKKYASSGLNWEEGAAAQPMRLEGIRRGPPAVGYLQIDPDNAITRTISSQAFMRDHGSPQVLAVHINFVAVGMSKGVVLVLPSKYSAHSADKMDSKMSLLGSQGEKSHSPVTSMCFNQQGDLLLAGYGDGHLTVWDVQKAAAVKIITGEHTAPVVHTLFLGQDSQVTRQFKAVTGDCKGLVLLHSFSVVPLLNRFSIKTQCILDGQRTGTVLSASPLLIDESYGLASAQGGATVSSGGLGSMMGGVVGGVVGSEAGWKLFSEGSSFVEEGVVIFVTHQTALVVRLSPNLEVYAQLTKPDGVREGSMPYTAWKCVTHLRGSSAGQMPAEGLDKASLLAIAWDRKVQVAKLVKSELKVYREWTLDNAAIGVNWLDDQMLVVLTLRGQLCLFSKEGTELHRTSFVVDGSVGDDIIVYHTHFTNIFGNPEKAYHNSVAVRGATIYILGPMHLVVSRLLPWKERIQVLQKAGDWMGALDMAMRLYDGHAHGVIDLPRTLDAIRGAIMQYLVELIFSYVDEVFSYISVAFCNQIGKVEQVDEPKTSSSSMQSEIGEQFARVGGVAVEFCVHIKRTDILFDNIFSKFVAVQHGGTFLELLEPYILKDMLGCLPPEIMQALVEHYSGKGWLQRVEQCVLHMDISSLDFNQVVRLCREHGLYGALIYLFNKGLNDFKAPLEELLVVVQNSQRENSTSIGYRMLVYLKYCFLGLAFPPGHGALPPALLPLLRTELIQFLLEDSNALNSQAVTNYKSSTRSFPNLCYLLWLDTEATLEVLKCAFFEEETPTSDNSFLSLVDASMEDNKENDIKNLENQNLIVQNTVNSLIHILNMETSEVASHSAIGENGYIEGWPSKKDLGLLLEFIACFVACKNATVSKNVLNSILEYLTSEGDHSLVIPGQKIETSRQREKQVVALLKVVPEKDWDASSVLRLCEKAQFYQVCGLIHTIRGEYVPALESYMKDVDGPIHAFAFINSMLLQLGDADSSFQSSVISRIPDLVNLSREGTFFLVIDHFSEQSQHILSKLQSDRKSLFLYLKTTIEVHLSGTLKFSFLERDDVVDAPFGKRIRNQSNEIQAYLERVSNFPKILRHNSVHVTDEMTELYLELLCQFERTSVLKFLKTFENYRLEHCLRLCQENGVTDAAAFLLERVGDVGSALQLTLSGLNEKFSLLGAALESRFSEITTSSSTEMELINTVLRLTEVDSVLDVLHASTGLCQRNTPRLDPQESEALWFQLLDSFCVPLRHLYDGKRVYEGRNRAGKLATTSDLQRDKEAFMDTWRVLNSDKGAQIVRRLFSRFVREIIDGMIGYVPLPTIMAKLLSDNGSQEFGDFKLTILGMLGTYGFERRILDTAKSLIEDDSYYTMSLLKKGASHAYVPNSFICCLCGCSLTKDSSTSSIRVFSCGHATHLQCEFPENEALKRDPLVGCPVCMPKKKNPRIKSKSVFVENGLFKNTLSRPQTQETTTGQRLHEFDVVEKPYMLPQMSRFEILSNLQKAQRSLQVETLPQLRLAPPAIYHEKVKKRADLLNGESSNSLTKSEKPSKGRQLRELKSKKGSSVVRFPLKSNIFSSEKNKRR